MCNMANVNKLTLSLVAAIGSVDTANEPLRQVAPLDDGQKWHQKWHRPGAPPSVFLWGRREGENAEPEYRAPRRSGETDPAFSRSITTARGAPVHNLGGSRVTPIFATVCERLGSRKLFPSPT